MLLVPAEWALHGKKAGYLRNEKMLRMGKPDLVVAFPGGVGTAMMVDLAKKKGLRVIDLRPNAALPDQGELAPEVIDAATKQALALHDAC